MKFPKIIIVGHSFQPSGIGITLKNLFSQFPKESLACISGKFYEEDKAFSSFYLLGHREISLMFPFNYLEKIKTSKVLSSVDYDNLKNPNLKVSTLSKIKHKIYKSFLKPFLNYTRLYVYRKKLNVSDELISWVKEIQPDIIYTALGSLNMMRFILDLHKKIPETKLAIHIMDDWILTQSEKALFSNRYKKKSYLYFGKILNESTVRFVISEKMAADYSKKFGGKFIPFHNPVNISAYINFNESQSDNEEKKITYIGKINRDNFDVINDLVKAVDKLNVSQNKCKFFIYTPTDSIFIKQHIVESSNIKIQKSVPHKEIPFILSNSDILFLPLSFKEKSKKYTRLSISTKVTEYMASNRPIIVYAPPDIALTEYVNKYRIASLVTERDVNKLIHTVQELLNNQDKSKRLASRAFTLAREKHSLLKVSADFKRILTGM